MNDNLNRIVYGKNSETNIVNVSVKNNTVYLFKEKEGVVSYETKPYVHWVLSPNRLPGWTSLKGDQHFRYMKEYANMSDTQYDAIRKSVYKQGLYNIFNFPEAFMVKNGHTYFKGMKVSDVSMLSWDIETSGLDPHSADAKVFLITNAFRKAGKVEKRTFNIEDYESQPDMINDWCKWVQDKDPSLFIGHNIIFFDIPYLNAIMKKHDQELILGRLCQPIEVEEKTRELRKDGSQSYTYHRINIFGREIVDTFFLAIKADIARKYENYRLKSIIKQEGLEKPGRTHYDAATIKDNWHDAEERAKIIAYAEDDADDPIKLFDLMIAPFFYLTPHIPKPFQLMTESATGSQINSLMVRSYIQDGYSVARADNVDKFEGAVSFGNVGIFDHVFKVDVASLYPAIMRYFKIFPVGKDFNNNFLAALEYFTEERLKNKRLAKETGDRHYKDLEQAQKVVINSAYGFMGATGLNYNYGEGASTITRHGREIISRAVSWATGRKLIKTFNNPKDPEEFEWELGEDMPEFTNRFTVSNCDTDSISFTTGSPLSEEERKRLLAELNALYPSMIRFEDDGYYQRLIILKAKNYILWDGKKVKLKGSSLRDQKKEPALKEMLGRIIDCLVHGNKEDIVAVYKAYIKETLRVEDIKRWSTKKTVTKAILNCATDPEARLNERKVYDAIAHTPIQEGDKVYLYPCIKYLEVIRTPLKNGKIREKVIKETGLKLADEWRGDHDSAKLVERVYKTVEILDGVLEIDQLVDYTLVKNKVLLDNL